jgi:hypothetical protein
MQEKKRGYKNRSRKMGRYTVWEHKDFSSD